MLVKTSCENALKENMQSSYCNGDYAEWIFWESLSAVRSVRKTGSHHGFHFESVVEHYVRRGHHHLCLSHLRHLVLQYKSTPVHLSYAKALMTKLFRQFGAPGGGLQPTHTSANSRLAYYSHYKGTKHSAQCTKAFCHRLGSSMKTTVRTGHTHTKCPITKALQEK